MNRAVVIKTFGDTQIAGAIVDGMTQRMIPLDEDELATIKAEYARLQAQDAVRRYGDEERWQDVRKALAIKYSTKPVKPLKGAILGAWALLWLWVLQTFRYFQAWNRESA